jgi:class 3 adenylate cyclase/CheY-like chemotaxis protein
MSDADPMAPDALAAMRHDLRTPITHILGYSEMLQEQAEELGQKEFLPELRKIQDAGKQLIGLVNELVGTSAARLEDVDFPRLRFELRTSLNHTVGYVEMLQERACELEQPGFLPDLEKVHAACRQLLAQMEAPTQQAGAGPAAPAGMQTEPGISPDDEAPPTIATLLVVDDNVQNRDLLGRQLRRQGYRVVHAGSGPAAMERIRAEKFDLVLLDVVMPGMNGYEVLQWLKADSDLRHIPVIMISAMNETESVVRCLVIGAEDYVSKPFDPILLKARIGSCLERSRWRKQEQTYLRQIEAEQARSERLLLNILPKPIADRLRQGEDMIVDSLPDVTVLFADLVAFTPHAASMPAIEMVQLLNDIFTAFDLLAEQRQVEKIKTIGDAYMAVGGLHAPQRDHAAVVVDLALAMQREVASFRAATQRPLHLRIGIHTGPVIAGIIGRHKFSYDLWGDTVNTASRMESHGEPDRVQVSAATHALLRDRYSFEMRGEIEIKGKGPMTTYFLLGESA